MSTREAAVALRRLGLGARPGDIARIASDPRGFVAGQLANPRAALLDDADLEPSHIVFAEAQRAQMAAKSAKEAAKLASAPAAPVPQPPAQGPMLLPPPAAPEKPQPLVKMDPAEAQGKGFKPGAIRRDALNDEVSARVDRCIVTDTPFLERWVLFWSNHFCVSVAKGPVRGIAGAYEREAIRPHSLGRFGDMLSAVAHHPAMLIYLDNHISIGPGSQAGRSRGRGLNENLARELLELHTLGVDGGYSQADVTSFARVLTGWTVGAVNQPVGEPGKFFFGPARHEPGVQTVLGKRYEDVGVRSGEAVLADLARHPSTARRIGRKLARHFLADEAPTALSDRLAQSFSRTGGDLAELARTLIGSPEIWAERPRKVLPPFDFAISLVRGFGVRPKAAEIQRVAAALGQPTWNVPAPKGWPDDDDAWMGPAAVRERLRIAEVLARQMDKLTDPRALAADILGDALTEETRSAIARSESREQGFELLAMAPEFLRR